MTQEESIVSVSLQNIAIKADHNKDPSSMIPPLRSRVIVKGQDRVSEVVPDGG